MSCINYPKADPDFFYKYIKNIVVQILVSSHCMCSSQRCDKNIYSKYWEEKTYLVCYYLLINPQLV